MFVLVRIRIHGVLCQMIPIPIDSLPWYMLGQVCLSILALPNNMDNAASILKHRCPEYAYW